MSARLVRVSLVAVEEIGGRQYVRASGMAGEEFARVLRLEPHGFASRPPVGAEGLALVMGPRRDQAFMLGLESGARPTGLGDGEAVLYHADGRRIQFKSAETAMELGGKPLAMTGVGGLTIAGSGTEVVMTFNVPVKLTAPVVYLGPGPGYEAVMTTAGPSSMVFATV